VLLTITSTTMPATDLGYLLHKHPDRVQRFESSVGAAWVCYPEATEERCTAALLLEVDPIGLVRGRSRGAAAFALAQYVNDRPYAASSLLSVAMGRVFRTAMAGRCEARPELVTRPLDLQIRVPSLSSTDGAGLVRRLFEPLGWAVDASSVPLDPAIPQWGESRYLDVTLTASSRLDAALSQLAVLLPVLDGGKHYWVGADEVDKVVRTAGDWLAAHPERELILQRSLARQRDLVVSAVGRLAETDDAAPEAFDNAVVGPPPGDDEPKDVPSPLRVRRVQACLAALRSVGAHRVVDMGCGEGALVRELVQDPAFAEIVAADVSPRALDAASRRLRLDRMPDSQRSRLRLLQSSLMYGDRRVAGFDAMVLAEVVEHIDPGRLDTMAHNVFAVARPGALVVTTPNADFNARYDALPVGTYRHADHRFEWTRAAFGAWCDSMRTAYGYSYQLRPVGDVDPDVGPPTQLALFTRTDERRAA
jgi:3' terminal RNA ribose 2'-O-methyltransferase Hen1